MAVRRWLSSPAGGRFRPKTLSWISSVLATLVAIVLGFQWVARTMPRYLPKD
jgi:flagellar biosynthesis protein FliQ